MLKFAAKHPMPSPQYLDVLVSGACQNKLPDNYIKKLKAVRHNGNTHPVKIYEDMKKAGIVLEKLWEI